VISADVKGSIHQVAAEVQGAPACNGWEFWYVERNGQAMRSTPSVSKLAR